MTENQEAQRVQDLVVVGSSAGGVGALSVLVSTLMEDFPAPIVLAQHLDPQRQSNLASILERRSTLEIVVASESGPTPLEAGKVYVVPANRHVQIIDGHVHLGGETNGRPKPSVDLLLSTAAKAYGEHLIAVILTGSGSDGASGAVEVKSAGGVVIIQNPKTAQYPSMPLSLPPTAVDYVVEIENIGPLLYDLLRGMPLVPGEKVEDPLRDLLEHVSRQANIDFRNYKSTTILRRISRRMAVRRTSSLSEYAHYLESNPEEITDLVKSFLINVTGFFRDPEAFEFLRDEILPPLIQEARLNGRSLRFWSAGCATGEEAYSLALLMADLLGKEFSGWNIRIFATDLDPEAVNFARRGLYPANVLENLPDDYRMRFFEPMDHGYRISKELRQTVIFGNQDLSRGAPFPRINMVICRNLLIYLKPELQQRVLELFAYSLQDSHGYLFLGKAETARPTNANFELVHKKWKVYRCLAGPHVLPALQNSPFSRIVSRGSGAKLNDLQVGYADQTITAPEVEVAQLRRLNESLLRCITGGVVIIDRSYHILTINPAARRILGIKDIAYDQDFLHTVRGLPYAELRNAIDKAFRDQAPTSLQELELDQSRGGSSKFVNVAVMLKAVESNSLEVAIINISDCTEQVQMKKRLEAAQTEQAQLVGELTGVNKRFSDMNKELQDANEELQAANEELMLTQEELQATNEEFEATNEELQATNEELETNNEELQATNEELQTTNDELSARTNELQELSRKLGEKQEQLSGLVDSIPYYITLLSAPDFRIDSINPALRHALEGREVIGLPLHEIFAGPDLPQFVETMKAAFEADETRVTARLQTQVNTREIAPGSFFVHTIVPVHNRQRRVTGVLIYSEDIAERDLRESMR